jgi:hypothetical protein
MRNRTAVIAAIVGGVIGLAIGIPAKIYWLDPYLASLPGSDPQIPETPEEAEKLRRKLLMFESVRRDELVVESIGRLDAQSRKSACSGYISGLKEQGLRASPDIHSACSGT